jgi:hypothetical protein
MKKLLFLAVVLFSITTIAQQNYDVVMLPKKFDFLNEDNKYNLNALTKSFFETEGFKVYYKEDIIPKEIANNRCTSMFADVIESNTLFVTKIEVVLKDCQNVVLFTSAVGESREKESAKAYNEAFRIALTSMRGKLKIKNTNATPIIIEEAIVKETVIVTEVALEKKIEVLSDKVTNAIQLFAIPTTTGFKLVDSKPIVIIELKSTTSDAVFIANKGEIIGVFIEKGNGWFFEYYQYNKLVSERIEVKF